MVSRVFITDTINSLNKIYHNSSSIVEVRAEMEGCMMMESDINVLVLDLFLPKVGVDQLDPHQHLNYPSSTKFKITNKPSSINSQMSKHMKLVLNPIPFLVLVDFKSTILILNRSHHISFNHHLACEVALVRLNSPLCNPQSNKIAPLIRFWLQQQLVSRLLLVSQMMMTARTMVMAVSTKDQLDPHLGLKAVLMLFICNRHLQDLVFTQLMRYEHARLPLIRMANIEILQ
jgi:hypothetical protein